MTNSEITIILQQFNDAWNGDPWFGKPVTALLDNITEGEAYNQPSGQHSIAQLVWHMVMWRQFVLSRMQPTEGLDSNYFEERDWPDAGPGNECTWQKGLAALHQTQTQVIGVLGLLQDDFLAQQVPERSYNFRKLLHGLVQHDIYHLGQIAYLRKIWAAQNL